MLTPTEKWHRSKLATLETSYRYLLSFAKFNCLIACFAGAVYLFAFAMLNTFDFDPANASIFSAKEIVLADVAMAYCVGLTAFSGPIAFLQCRCHRYLQSTS